MYVLGLNIGHNATACLLKDGKIVSCVSEERFNRQKNYCGIPFKSIEYVLKDSGISMENISKVILDDYYPIYKDRPYGKIYQEAYTKKSFINKIKSRLVYNFPKTFKIYSYLKEKVRNKEKFNKKIIRGIASSLKIKENKIILVNHHLLHAMSPCFNLNKTTLIFTSDGEGSGLCATINIWNGKELKVISKTNKNDSVACLYAIATIYLGMKPLEHEFKVMGLAPYAKKDKVEEVYLKLRNLFWIDNNLEIHCKYSTPFINNFFEKEMRFVRFDTFAAAVQKLVEELNLEWISRAIKKTGIKDIALSGGLFMNVKASQRISELKELRSLFVMPSCGDESNAIGACFYGYKKYCEENKIDLKPQPLEGLYLGPEYGNDYVENLIKVSELDKKYIIKKVKNINQEIAKLLANGKIVARCTGRSEWGARALGNRSILANALNPNTIRILNETIKDRDFWMPFTPSIIDKYQKKYFFNPKNIFSPYMVITFNSTEEARKRIPAAMHPYDQTLRPQVVTKDYNKDYYEIIEHFSKLTGAGGILNTSFNLHGEPNVLTPEDALHTVENSDLKYLAMGDYLFEKK
jgi:carbamoyltransferase